MTSIERRYTLFSPSAEGGGERPGGRGCACPGGTGGGNLDGSGGNLPGGSGGTRLGGTGGNFPSGSGRLGGTGGVFPGGSGGERLGEIMAVVSRLSADELTGDDVERSRITASACVRRECAPAGGFVRGMRLVRGTERWRVLSAVLCARLWVLRLERTVMDGEV